MNVEETLREVLQEMVLPDLRRIIQNRSKIRAELHLTKNERIDDMNTHLEDQSRRIDVVRSQLTQRIDETNKRINEVQMNLINRLDGNNARIDRFFETSRTTEHELRRIDDRVASLEHEAEAIKQRMAA